MQHAAESMQLAAFNRQHNASEAARNQMEPSCHTAAAPSLPPPYLLCLGTGLAQGRWVTEETAAGPLGTQVLGLVGNMQDARMQKMIEDFVRIEAALCGE